MAQTTTQRLMELGVPFVMASELMKQINAGSYNWQRLMNAGWVTELAQYFAKSLAAGNYKATKAVEYGCVPAVATLIAGGGVPRLKIVGSNGRSPTTLAAGNATKTHFQSRNNFSIGVNASEIRLTFDNWIIDATGAEQLPAGPMTIDKVALESTSLAQFVVVTFGGQRSAVVAAGQTIVSDPIPASAFGLSRFSRGEQYWSRSRGHVDATTGQIPYGRIHFATGNKGSQFDPATSTDNVDAVGTMPAQTGETANVAATFTAAIGIKVGTEKSFVAVGDSIAAFLNDTTTALSQPGFVSRAAFDTSFQNPLPMLNMARSSALASGFVASSTRRVAYFAYADVLIDELGTNDLGANGAGSVPTLQANLQAIWGLARTGGVSGIIRTKLTPRALSSSDSYATSAGQTLDATFVSKANQFNSWLASVVGSEINTLLSMNGVRDAVDLDRWITTGAANYATSDGLHPSPAAHLIMAAELRAAMLAA